MSLNIQRLLGSTFMEMEIITLFLAPSTRSMEGVALHLAKKSMLEMITLTLLRALSMTLAMLDII